VGTFYYVSLVGTNYKKDLGKCIFPAKKGCSFSSSPEISKQKDGEEKSNTWKIFSYLRIRNCFLSYRISGDLSIRILN
jgi:hypothetical protein